MSVKLTVCLPGIRAYEWDRVYLSLKESMGRHSFELIIVGPTPPPPSLNNLPEIRYIPEYGSPSRCVQIAALAAEGDLYTFISDDGILRPNSMEKAIDAFDCTLMVMRYTEGHNFSGGLHSQPNDYWTAWFHADLRKECLRGYYTSPVWMMKTSDFIDMGGLDCRFEHVNMCCLDLSFRVQRSGGEIKLSPDFIMDCEWSSHKRCIVVDAYHENDKPLFDSLCDSSEDPFKERVHIDYNNWMDASPVWERRFNVAEASDDYRYK
jgi:hypothetical protein